MPNPMGGEARLVGSRCLDCLHLTDLLEGTCQAFPGGIPEDILQDRVLHDRPYPGDHGLRFDSASERQGRPRWRW